MVGVSLLPFWAAPCGRRACARWSIPSTKGPSTKGPSCKGRGFEANDPRPGSWIAPRVIATRSRSATYSQDLAQAIVRDAAPVSRRTQTSCSMIVAAITMLPLYGCYAGHGIDTPGSDGGMVAGEDGSVTADAPIASPPLCLPVGERRCTGQPEDAPGAFEVASSGATLYWRVPRDVCIPTTHDPRLSTAHVESIRGAIEDWNGLHCGICLAPPSPSSRLPDGSRCDLRVHFVGALNGPGLDGGSVLYRESSGELVGAIAAYGLPVAPPAPSEIHHAIGHALALDHREERSVMNASNPANAPTAADQMSLCAMYGDSPYCGR